MNQKELMRIFETMFKGRKYVFRTHYTEDFRLLFVVLNSSTQKIEVWECGFGAGCSPAFHISFVRRS